MKRGMLLAVLAGLFLCTSSASAVKLVTPNGHRARPSQGYANHSHIPTVDRTVVMHFNVAEGRRVCGQTAGALACSTLDEIWYAEPGERDDEWTLLHELGHEFDWFVLTDRDRQRFIKIAGMGPGDWETTRDGVWWSPDEEFAQTYAACAFDRLADVEATEIPAWRVRRGCKLIRAAYWRSQPRMRNTYRGR